MSLFWINLTYCVADAVETVEFAVVEGSADGDGDGDDDDGGGDGGVDVEESSTPGSTRVLAGVGALGKVELELEEFGSRVVELEGTGVGTEVDIEVLEVALLVSLDEREEPLTKW